LRSGRIELAGDAWGAVIQVRSATLYVANIFHGGRDRVKATTLSRA